MAETSVPNPKKESPGVMAWRAVYTLGLGVIGLLGLFVLDVVKDTSKQLNLLTREIAGRTSSLEAVVNAHDKRLGRLEDWRNSTPTMGRP